MTLLIVDDNAAVRRLLRSIVAPWAQNVLECADGSEVSDLYASCRPDVVLMDIELKDVDGITAARRLLAEFPKAHIIMVTQYDDPALREAAANIGARGYVLKENLLELNSFLQEVAVQRKQGGHDEVPGTE